MTETWHNNLKTRNREDLIAAAKELFIKESFLRVNVKEICSLAGISRVTFYKHFQTIDELVFEVQMEILGDMTGYIKKAPEAGMTGKQMLVSMLTAWIEYAAANPGYIRFILLFDLHYEAYGTGTALKSQYEAFIGREKEQHFLLNALETGVKDQSLLPDPELLETAHFIFTSMMALLQKMCMTVGDGSRTAPQDIRVASRFAELLVAHLSAGAKAE
ncbi:TetR family transcriptional regulator [Paenibacillus sp. FSL R7-0273]|uniref:TetR/AcrR family transcriptional regulator n=1 Tax=Paenibacillus sp. FSL R7-0273 TaxID=1536772 RepID=UPI0004F642B9|nr:TetR/AcrR family transcriptional regulator [Paenibacillus sp. FSL R7-0273]AIQ47270.1 TetR family transcriptional regulator [Paenibacillus sp. FSL R7-0273]OMF91585.1 TetR family transcriptional regulator [Paenibacillus sp. FSL R7-0273]